MLTVAKYPFSLVRRLFSYLYHRQNIWYLIWNRNWLSFASTWVLSRIFGGVRVAYRFSFLCCVLALFAFVVPSVAHLFIVSSVSPTFICCVTEYFAYLETK